MKCKNCGAELNNGKCEYCGSVFPEEVRLLTLKTPQISENVIRKVLLKANLYQEKDNRMHKERIEVTCLGDSEPHYIEGV